MIVDVDPSQSMIFYPARYAALSDLVEVPHRARVPTSDESSGLLASVTPSNGGFKRYTFIGVVGRVEFWNSKTRELLSVGSWGGRSGCYV